MTLPRRIPATPTSAERQRFTWSPDPEPSVKVDRIRHNPYSMHNPILFGSVESLLPEVAPVPEGTVHATALWNKVTYVQYPKESFIVPTDALPGPAHLLKRVFLGQLPYFLTSMELNWIIATFGGNNTVVDPERILKTQHQSGERLPTGCIHAYTTPEAIDVMVSLMHKRILIDDTGVWYAQSDSQMETLREYCDEMKRDKSRRPQGLPYDTVVVQPATSRFFSHHPVLVDSPPPPPLQPPPYEATVYGSSGSAPPPPPPPPPPYYAYAAQYRQWQ